MLFPILTIVGGLLAGSSFILARKPNAAVLYEKVAPYQGILGVGLVGCGVYQLVAYVIPSVGILSQQPVTFALLLAGLALDIVIGFILGFALLNKLLLSKNPSTEVKGKQVLAKVMPIQGPLGVAAVLVGIGILLKIQFQLF